MEGRREEPKGMARVDNGLLVVGMVANIVGTRRTVRGARDDSDVLRRDARSILKGIRGIVGLHSRKKGEDECRLV